MKLKPSTLILLISALVLGGIALFAQNQPQQEAQSNASQNAASPNEGAPAVDFDEEDIQQFTLETQDRTLSFERNSQGEWQMTAPERQPANDASVAYLLNLITTGVTRTITVPSGDRQPYGLDQPLATINLELNNQQNHQLLIGRHNFDRSSLYAQLNPPATPEANTALLLVSTDFETAVNRPTPEWIASPTPSPTPTPSPSPAPSP